MLFAREKRDKTVVCILIGSDPLTNAPRAYIGEAEVIRDQLKQHKTKEFWISAIVFMSTESYPYVAAQRKQLIADGMLIDKNGFLVFSRDAEFSSPSAAAVFIHGRTANGLTTWKTEDGKSLKKLDELAYSETFWRMLLTEFTCFVKIP